MNSTELKTIINEAVKEVLQEALIAPVDKDPDQMSNDEKKQALAAARLKAGVSDPTEPIDLIKKEGEEEKPKPKLREMARTAIMYSLAPDWEEKYPTLDPAFIGSIKRKKWIDGIIAYLQKHDHAQIKVIAHEQFDGSPQQMINTYANDMVAKGVLMAVGLKGQEITADTPAPIPQFMRDPEDEPQKRLSDFGKFNRSYDDKPDDPVYKVDPEDMLVGPHFADDFGDDSKDSMEYSFDHDVEPEDDEIEHTNKVSRISSGEMDILMKYDDLVKDIAIIKSNLSRASRLHKAGKGLDEISDLKHDDAASQRRLLLLYKRKKEELEALLTTNGDLIAKYRTIGKSLRPIINTSVDTALSNDIDTAVPIDEVKRLQRLAGIIKQ